MALGARSVQIVWSVARDVTFLVAAGTGLGLALSLIVIMLMRSSAAPAPGVDLYRPSIDPVALLAIALFMTIVGLAAAFVPARRAATMDPLAALRHD
jgi:putative ABC transport system permease protein